MINELTFCELRAKEVINAADGKKLGKITDIVFTTKGIFKGIVAPYSKKLFVLKSQEIFIPFCNIKKIGEDVIIVELPPQFNNKNCVDFKPDGDNVCEDRYVEKRPCDDRHHHDECDNRCEKCMLFDCKRRWSKKEGRACIDDDSCER